MSIIIKGITKAQFYKDTNKIPCMDVGWDIVELPPHGRLIDADALTDNCMKEDGFIAEMLFRKVSNAPTVIEAEVTE